MADSGPLFITVVYAPAPRQVLEIPLTLPAGSQVASAIEASGLLLRFPAMTLDQDSVGVWGRKAGPRQLLRDGDRVELYRSLLVDPKVARRERFVKQGAKTSGLFATRRPGAKAGY